MRALCQSGVPVTMIYCASCRTTASQKPGVIEAPDKTVKYNPETKMLDFAISGVFYLNCKKCDLELRKHSFEFNISIQPTHYIDPKYLNVPQDELKVGIRVRSHYRLATYTPRIGKNKGKNMPLAHMFGVELTTIMVKYVGKDTNFKSPLKDDLVLRYAVDCATKTVYEIRSQDMEKC